MKEDLNIKYSLWIRIYFILCIHVVGSSHVVMAGHYGNGREAVSVRVK